MSKEKAPPRERTYKKKAQPPADAAPQEVRLAALSPGVAVHPMGVHIVDAATGTVLATGRLEATASGVKGAAASINLSGSAAGTSTVTADLSPTTYHFIPTKRPAAEFTPPLLVSFSDQHTQAAIRSMWASPAEWQLNADSLPYFNDKRTGVQVSVMPGGRGASTNPEAIAEASKTVLALDDQTVSAFIICMGKWFAEAGARAAMEPVRVHVADVLGFRGIKKHVNGGYRPEQKEEAKQDILLLRNIWVRSRDEVWEKGTTGKRKLVSVTVDDPLLEVSIENTTDLWGEESPYAFRVRPGGWARHYLTGGTNWTTKVLRPIMQYHPYHDRLAMRLGIYLAFQWRIRSSHGNWDQPWKLRTLLEGAKIDVPKRNPQRFFPQVEAALAQLHRDGALSVCECLDTHTWPPPTADGPPKSWVPRRLNDRWHLLPPADVVTRPQRAQLARGKPE